MTHYAQLERQALCDLFLEVGPDAPTLCEGWRTADLAAHLVLRERRPDAAVGIVVPALAQRTERVQRRIRDATGWPELVRRVRGGPPVLLRPFDEVANTVEYFIHHEDVRRAGRDDRAEVKPAGGPGAKDVGEPGAGGPRSLDPGFERALWGRLRAMSKLMLRRSPVGLVLEAPGYGRHIARRGVTEVTVSGAPGELLLWASGRKGAAQVTLSGPAEAVEAVERAPFGL
jgi:uncharacterized protein (TIGR03085 family)